MFQSLTMRAGQTGRLSFDIRPAGDYALVGAVRSCGGVSVAMEQRGADLFIPAGLAPGLHLLEVRAGGRTILYGGLEVLPSPLAEEVGEAGWHVEADLSEEVANITLTLEEGPAGPAGERGPAGPQGVPGEPGAPGAPGKGVYELWLEAGNSGSPEDYLASLRPTVADIRGAVDTDLFLPEGESRGTPAGAGNGYMSDLELDARHVPVGLLSRIDFRARSSGANPATSSYLGLWEQSEDGTGWQHLGVSSNAPAQFGGQDAVWHFDDIPLHGRPLRLLVMESREAVWRTGPVIGICTNATPAGDGSYIHYKGTRYSFLPQLTLHYRRPREIYAPAEHVADATAHLSSEEHAWLQDQRLHGSSHPVFSHYITVGYFDRKPEISPDDLAAATDIFLDADICNGSGWGALYVWFGEKPSDVFLGRLGYMHADLVTAFHFFTLPLTALSHGSELGEFPPYTFPDGTRAYPAGTKEYPLGTGHYGTVELPGGSREFPNGTVERPSGTREFLSGTLEVPGGGRIYPSGTFMGAAGTSHVPGGATELPGGTAFFPGGTTELPGGTAFIPGGVVGLPGGTLEYPGGTSAFPGGSVELPGGTALAPGGTVGLPGGTDCFPGGTVALPGGTDCFPGGTVALPGGTALAPAGTDALPGGTVEFPGGTASFPDGTRENPLGTRFIPNNGEIYYPNGTVEYSGGTKCYSSFGTREYPFGTVHYPQGTIGLPNGTIVEP